MTSEFFGLLHKEKLSLCLLSDFFPLYVIEKDQRRRSTSEGLSTSQRAGERLLWTAIY